MQKITVEIDTLVAQQEYVWINGRYYIPARDHLVAAKFYRLRERDQVEITHDGGRVFDVSHEHPVREIVRVLRVDAFSQTHAVLLNSGVEVTVAVVVGSGVDAPGTYQVTHATRDGVMWIMTARKISGEC